MMGGRGGSRGGGAQRGGRGGHGGGGLGMRGGGGHRGGFNQGQPSQQNNQARLFSLYNISSCANLLILPIFHQS